MKLVDTENLEEHWLEKLELAEKECLKKFLENDKDSPNSNEKSKVQEKEPVDKPFLEPQLPTLEKELNSASWMNENLKSWTQQIG